MIVAIRTVLERSTFGRYGTEVFVELATLTIARCFSGYVSVVGLGTQPNHACNSLYRKQANVINIFNIWKFRVCTELHH